MLYKVMLRSKWSFAVLVLIAMLTLGGWRTIQSTKLDDATLKTTLAGLGYEVKEPGVSTFEIPIVSGGLNIPTRVFISKSKSKVWLSVALLKKEAVDKLTREELLAILEENVKVGPCHFMIEGGWLKLKMALDNRDLTPAVMRTELDYLAARVAESKPIWQK